MTPHFLVLYTGGTIGSVQTDKGYAPSENFAALLQQKLVQADDVPHYTLLAFDELIDSSNLHPKHWTQIADCLLAHWDNYTGFVVLHGTDTMAYSASALSFMLRDLDKPIIFTGSQIPLVETRNDALDNILTAFAFASDTRLNEVCLCFNGKLLRGNRSRKVDSGALTAFDSPNHPVLGTMGIDAQLATEYLLSHQSLKSKQSLSFEPQAVSLLMLYPTISAQLVTASIIEGKTKALVLLSYGAGNPPSDDQAFMQALKQVAEQGVVIVNLTQCQRGQVNQGIYVTGHAMNELGIVAGGDMTPEAAFTKLHVLIAQGCDAHTIREQMQLNWCGELSE